MANPPPPTMFPYKPYTNPAIPLPPPPNYPQLTAPPPLPSPTNPQNPPNPSQHFVKAVYLRSGTSSASRELPQKSVVEEGLHEGSDATKVSEEGKGDIVREISDKGKQSIEEKKEGECEEKKKSVEEKKRREEERKRLERLYVRPLSYPYRLVKKQLEDKFMKFL